MDPERALADRCLRGEEKAWLELLRLYQRKVLRVLFRSGVREELDDLCQEVWARLLARDGAALRDFRAGHPGALGLFLAQVARRVAIDHDRARRVRPPPSGGAEPDELAHAADSPELLARGAEERRRLSLALDAAAGSARDRDILRLHYEEGLSVSEIAQMGLASSRAASRRCCAARGRRSSRCSRGRNLDAAAGGEAYTPPAFVPR
jgi:RNA polymerase sigma factor (sigma-70 family)